MLIGLFSKILIFTNLMIITMVKIMTSQLTVALAMQIHFSIMIIILSHMDFFKYQNMMFKLKNVNKIHYAPYLVGYLLTKLNIHF